MALSTPDYESQIWERVILPQAPTMSRAAAEEILRLSFQESDHQRMSELAAKARAGTLTPAEAGEAAGYGRVSRILGYLKSKARVSLRSAADE
jgi:hypothetical protein